jgi:hypothetical protein
VSASLLDKPAAQVANEYSIFLRYSSIMPLSLKDLLATSSGLAFSLGLSNVN